MNLSALLFLVTLGSTSAAIGLIDEDFFNKLSIMYTSQHDIVNIFMATCSDNEAFIFFVEADQVNVTNNYQGLYVIKLAKDKNTTKLLLEGGKDVDCDADKIYIGANDGIYTFNKKELTAEKYGNVTENIKNIAKVKGSDLFYILTEDSKLYRVTENGTKMTIDDTIVDAQQIVLDSEHNLYYYPSDKEPWVVSGGVKRKVEGLPKELSYVRLLKPPKLFQRTIPVVVNNGVYVILSNGSSAPLNYTVLVKPSAYSVELGLIQFFGYNKTVYIYYFLIDIIEEIGKYINGRN